VPETLSNVVFNGKNQSGSGARRRKTSRHRRKRGGKRVRRDIFS
jgi:hypothetical protein